MSAYHAAPGPAPGQPGMNNPKYGKLSRLAGSARHNASVYLGFDGLRPWQKGVLGAEYAGAVTAWAGASYVTNPLAKIADNTIALAFGTGAELKRFFNSFLSDDEGKALKDLDARVLENAFRANNSQVQLYIDNFQQYKKASWKVDQTRTSLEAAQRRSIDATKDTIRLPGQGLYEKLWDTWAKKVLGKNVDDPNYAENVMKGQQAKTDAYAVMRKSSDTIFEEMGKPAPNLHKVASQAKNFNTAYDLVIKSDTLFRQGIEKADKTNLVAMKKQLDTMKPGEFPVGPVEVLAPIVIAGVVYYGARKVIKVTQWVFRT